jgi:pyruvate formate lyase activating enzyme
MYDSLRQCGREMTVKEVLEEVLRDEDFYRNSGGGMTVSGGEALSQSEFVTDLLRAAREAGVHTALDTTGYAPWEKMERTIPFVDLILWDIKHLDSREHKWGTGLENKLILENLKKASGLAVPIWLRMPLIKDFNDSEAHIQKITALGKEISAGKISLLPYHEGGKTKCEQMGRDYPFPEGESPTDEEIERLKGIIESEGLKVSIGS